MASHLGQGASWGCEWETPLLKWTKGSEPGAATCGCQQVEIVAGVDIYAGEPPFLVVRITRKNVVTGTSLTPAECCWLYTTWHNILPAQYQGAKK